jgi:hypothetical protein
MSSTNQLLSDVGFRPPLSPGDCDNKPGASTPSNGWQLPTDADPRMHPAFYTSTKSANGGTAAMAVPHAARKGRGSSNGRSRSRAPPDYLTTDNLLMEACWAATSAYEQTPAALRS